MDESSASFGERLRRLRETAGLSQEELAERAQLSAKAIGALERGDRRRPYPSTLRQLAAALELDDAARADLFAAAGRTSDPRSGLTMESATPSLAELPHYLTPIVGRQREVEMVRHLLHQPELRLLTLTGPGGIGKTRLAIEVARQCASSYPGGLFFVDLTPLSNAEQVSDAIAQVVGAREGSGHTAIQNAATALRDRAALLLLDNCEHVLESTASIVALLTACPLLVILATSRARLRLRGEQEYRVPPLTLPRATVAGVNDPAGSAAVQLFLERARSVRSDFAPTPEESEVVARICEQLDGLPLAIELAAARVSLLSPVALLSRLFEGLALLASGPRDLPQRQRTMRDAIAWSHDLLSEPERVALRRLAIFVNGCSLEAAEAVCAVRDDQRSDVLQQLLELQESSLIYRLPGDDNREPRIAMLGTIRSFALEHLQASGEFAQIAARHAAYYETLAKTASLHLMAELQVEWLKRLQRDTHNLRAAIRWLLERREYARVVVMTWALWRYWWLAGLQRNARQWMSQVLSPQAGVQELSAQHRAEALLVVGSMAWSEGDSSVAVEALTSARDLCRELGNGVEQAVAAMMLGLALLDADALQTEMARTYFEESRQLFRAANMRWGEVFAVGYLGLIPLLRGEVDQASAYFNESLEIARESSHDRVPFHQALYSLGLVAQLRGEHRQADERFREGLHLADELGDLVNVGYFLKGMGQTAGMLGRAEQAALLLGAAEAALAATGSPPYRYLWNRNLDEQVISRTRQRIGDEPFASLWSLGRSMGLDQAVAAALIEEELDR